MAKPAITYIQGFLDDGDTAWSNPTRYNMTAGQTECASENGDYLRLKGVCDSADNEYYYEEDDITGVGSTYTNILIRHKTSVASNGLAPAVEAVYTDASTQKITLDFSTSWMTTSGTLTYPTGESLDKLRIYADDDPDSLAAGTFYTYYDFIMIYGDTFAFPYVSDKIQLNVPNRFADIPIPGRVTDITQNLGAGSAIITLTGDMELDDWGTAAGEALLRAIHEATSEPFQWFTCDKPKLALKVTIRDFDPFYQGGASGKPGYKLVLKEYSLCDKANESYAERFGL